MGSQSYQSTKHLFQMGQQLAPNGERVDITIALIQIDYINEHYHHLNHQNDSFFTIKGHYNT